MQPELASMQSTPIFLECLLFEKLTAGRMDGETDQKNLIWLPSFGRLWGRFKVSFVSHSWQTDSVNCRNGQSFSPTGPGL